MHIVFILKYFPSFGGGETITISLANQLIANGYIVSIIYFIDSNHDNLPYINQNINTLRLSKPENSNINNNIKELNRYLTENTVDIIINQWGKDYTNMCYQAKMNTNAKLVVCLHMDPFLRQAINGINVKSILKILTFPLFLIFEDKIRCWRSKYYSIYKQCDKYVFLSESYRSAFIKKMKLPIDDAKLDAIPNSVPYTNLITDIQIGCKKNNILFVGRMENIHKRIHLILMAWKKIETKISNDWHLILIGEGIDLPKLKEQSHKLDLKNIEFTGFKDPKPYYLDASLLLMTSAYEGLPMVLLEAQQNGVVPIVMDSFSSVHDIIENGVNGIITPNNDLNSFANQILNLIDDYDERMKLAKQAVISSRNFSQDIVFEKWKNLFLELRKI